MKTRFVRALALAGFAVAVPALAFAQTARVQGLGVQGDYIKDYTGIFTYVSGVNSVGNLIYGELGNSNSPNGFDDRAVGAVLGNLWDGRFGTWSIHLREQTPQLGQGDASSQPGTGAFGIDPNVNSNQAFDLIWGRKFGNTSLGLRLNRSHYSEEGDLGLYNNIEYDYFGGTPDVDDANFARNVLGFGAGLGFELSPTHSMEIGLLYESRTFEFGDTLGNTSSDDGPTTYQLAVRTMWQWQPNVLVVPVFKWYSYDLSFKDAAAPAVEQTWRGWQIGAAGNWTLGSNDLFVLGATFAQNKFESDINSLELTESYMPEVFAALETRVNPWLTLRFGARKGVFGKIEQEVDAPASVEFRGSPFTFALGTGIKLGTLQIDATLDNEFVHNMPYLISGDDTSNMFPKVTATYAF